MTKKNVVEFRAMKQRGDKIAMLTAYDASCSALLVRAGIDVILVGDSLGNVVQGHSTTLPVTVEEMLYHTQCVRRGAPDAFVIADLPFLADSTPVMVIENAGKLMKQGGAQMVKLEGGANQVRNVELLTAHQIPVCGHLGLLPQSVHKVGGYRVQGRDEVGAAQILADAKALEEAGADMIVLECVPSLLADQIRLSLAIPIIGIGAGVGCDGQVLVLYDMLGLTSGKRPKFSHDFLVDSRGIQEAVETYVKAVKAGTFPANEHSFS